MAGEADAALGAGEAGMRLAIGHGQAVSSVPSSPSSMRWYVVSGPPYICLAAVYGAAPGAVPQRIAVG